MVNLYNFILMLQHDSNTTCDIKNCHILIRLTNPTSNSRIRVNGFDPFIKMDHVRVDLYSFIHLSQHDLNSTREHELPPLLELLTSIIRESISRTPFSHH
jgi:hypothetical protein